MSEQDEYYRGLYFVLVIYKIITVIIIHYDLLVFLTRCHNYINIYNVLKETPNYVLGVRIGQ